ncbi:MAG: hypothetical protein V1733_08265 [bacterium]
MTNIVNQLKGIHWKQVLIITLIAFVAVSFDACKSTGKLSRKEKKAQIEMYKRELGAIVNGTSKLSLDEQDRIISEAVNKNFNDPELNQLIIQAQQKSKAAYAEKVKLHEQQVAAARNKLYDLIVNKQNLSADELEAEMNAIKAQNLNNTEIDELIGRLEKKISEMRQYSSVETTLKAKLEGSFQAIVDATKAGNTSMANSLINSALNYFSSPDVPVLIIISREGAIVDYDKPTTIGKYLNFVKDQKDNRNAVDSYQLDAAGKIKELDLIKK